MSRSVTPDHKYLVHDTQKSRTGFAGGTVSFHKDLKSASRAAEKRNLEYGAHRYSARPLSNDSASQAKLMQAKAALMEETRLATKADDQHKLAEATLTAEKKLPKTAEALGHLGAGKQYGE